jgi:molybdopterin synthase catalytic subunit/molybdopterin converting factor small subunit
VETSNPETVTISLRHFAIVRETIGSSHGVRRYEHAPTAGEVLDDLTHEHPGLSGLRKSMLIMVNQQYAAQDTVLHDGDEVAFIPPVSGGAPARLFRVTDQPLDARETEAAVRDPSCGAVITFTGEVRDQARGQDVTALDYEAYAEAAERMMTTIADEIERELGVDRIAIVHRVGLLSPGDASVVISVASPHRDEAFKAARHAIERLKLIVPIWKKEHYAGGATWIGSEADYQRELGRES